MANCGPGVAIGLFARFPRLRHAHGRGRLSSGGGRRLMFEQGVLGMRAERLEGIRREFWCGEYHGNARSFELAAKVGGGVSLPHISQQNHMRGGGIV